jgi:hypothetical protein
MCDEQHFIEHKYDGVDCRRHKMYAKRQPLYQQNDPDQFNSGFAKSAMTRILQQKQKVTPNDHRERPHHHVSDRDVTDSSLLNTKR